MNDKLVLIRGSLIAGLGGVVMSFHPAIPALNVIAVAYTLVFGRNIVLRGVNQ